MTKPGIPRLDTRSMTRHHDALGWRFVDTEATRQLMHQRYCRMFPNG